MADEGNEVEGVRILGAKEAGELAGKPGPSQSSKTPKKTSSKKAKGFSTEPTSKTDLPHWREAPTGEVPATVVDAATPGDGWEALTGSQPRIRVDQSDWKNVDYDPSLSLMDESMSVGALGNDHISLNDTDDEFEKTVAEKRGVKPTSAEKNPTGSQRVTKISTVPDSVSTTPVEGEGSSSPGLAAKTSRARPASTKAKRDKRVGSESHEVRSEDGELPNIGSEARMLITRSITAVALATIAIIVMFLGPVPTLIFAALVISAMSLELCSAFRQIGSKPAGLLVTAMSFFSVIAGYLVGDRAVALSAVTFFVFAGLWYLFAVVRARPVIGLGISTLVYMYVGILGSFAGMILALEDAAGKSIGIFVFVSTVLCVVANDTAAYLFGKFMGRTPLAPAISPNKTMEGTTAGIIAALLVGIFIVISSSEAVWGGVGGGIALGILIAVASIFGDLIESMLKRDCNLKDFGSILPGHGGLMDRFDGLLFALPVAYYLALTLI